MFPQLHVPLPPPSPALWDARGSRRRGNGSLRDEMSELRSMVRELLQWPVAVAPAGAGRTVSGPPEMPQELSEYYSTLIQNEVAEEIAREVMTQACDRLAQCKVRAGKLAENAAALQQLVAVMLDTIEGMLPRRAGSTRPQRHHVCRTGRAHWCRRRQPSPSSPLISSCGKAKAGRSDHHRYLSHRGRRTAPGVCRHPRAPVRMCCRPTTWNPRCSRLGCVRGGARGDTSWAAARTMPRGSSSSRNSSMPLDASANSRHTWCSRAPVTPVN